MRWLNYPKSFFFYDFCIFYKCTEAGTGNGKKDDFAARCGYMQTYSVSISRLKNSLCRSI